MKNSLHAQQHLAFIPIISYSLLILLSGTFCTNYFTGSMMITIRLELKRQVQSIPASRSIVMAPIWGLRNEWSSLAQLSLTNHSRACSKMFGLMELPAISAALLRLVMFTETSLHVATDFSEQKVFLFCPKENTKFQNVCTISRITFIHIGMFVLINLILQ